MSYNYPENYLSIRWKRLSASAIATEFASLSQIAELNDTEIKANLEAKRKLLEIEYHLTNAHELYFKKQYQLAIDEYKLTQGLIYQLLQPDFPIDSANLELCLIVFQALLPFAVSILLYLVYSSLILFVVPVLFA